MAYAENNQITVRSLVTIDVDKQTIGYRKTVMNLTLAFFCFAAVLYTLAHVFITLVCTAPDFVAFVAFAFKP